MRRPNEIKSKVESDLTEQVKQFMSLIDRSIEAALIRGEQYPIKVDLGCSSKVRACEAMISLKLSEAGWNGVFGHHKVEKGQWDSYKVQYTHVKVSPIAGEE